MPKTRQPAANAPVARVLPLLRISHLDRIFEYRIDEEQDMDAQPGVRVRIRFAGRLIDGILLERSSTAEHTGALQWLDRVISSDIVYPEKTRRLIEALSERYGGMTSDLIRAAIPSRHAKAEESDTSIPWAGLGEAKEPDLSYWSSYNYGESFVDAVITGHIARAAWQIAPGDDWAAALCSLAVKVVKDGYGALIIVPDQKDIDQLVSAAREWVSAKQITVLNSQMGPQARYRRFLSVLNGQGRLVIGTRSAAFAPVENLRLAVIKDDGDDNLVDPRAPYVHAREVLTTRSTQEKCSLILAGHGRTAETQLLVESGWAHDLVASRDTIRTRMPRISAAGDSEIALQRDRFAKNSRLPSSAYQAIKGALDRSTPALIQVPRTGYVPTLACKSCGSPARCRHCNGPLGLDSGSVQSLFPGPQNQRNRAQTAPPPANDPYASSVPTCRWCGRKDNHYRCGSCGKSTVRAVVLGHDRTAEEFGRAFPKTRIITSGGNKILDSIPAEPAIVIATPGAEPLVSGGEYGAAVFLDTWAMLGRQDLRATEDALAAWLRAAHLVVRHSKGGEVVIVADPALPVVQHLVRWDVVGAAERELKERREVRFPPTVHMAAVDGAATAINNFLELAALPDHAEILGPVDLPPGLSLPGEYDESQYGPPQRILIRTPLGPRSQLGHALRTAQRARALRKENLPLRVQIDPIRIG